MGRSPRLLIIHAGGPKTGSSALQNYLEFNAARLAECGIDYENRLGITQRDKISSGNGRYLFEELQKNSTEDRLPGVIESYFKYNNTAVCSSETLSLLTAEHWQLLYNHTEKLHIKIHIIFFIRNVAPFCISQYDQLIKRHGLQIDLLTLLKTDSSFIYHVKFLKEIVKFSSKFKLSVIHYDLNKTKSIDKFIELLPLKFSPPSPENNLIVNRSLSQTERELLLRLNKILGGEFSAEVSDRIIYASPNKAVDRQYNPEFLEYIQEKFSDDVFWINEKFFAGQQIVKILDENDLLESQTKSITDEGTEVHDLILDWTCEKISSSEQHITSLRQHIASLRQHIASLEQHIASLEKENIFDTLLRLLKNFLRPAKNFLKRIIA